VSTISMARFPNPPQFGADPHDSYRCRVCDELMPVGSVDDWRYRMGICDVDECLESRVSTLVAVELDKARYAEMLGRISRVVVPQNGGAVDVRKLQASLLACTAGAQAALRLSANPV
jgi:hypothetical protein